MARHDLSGMPTAPDAPEVIASPPEQSSLRPGMVIASRYEVRHRLGTGGMGAVWHVHDRALGEDVALKVILSEGLADSASIARFRDEVKIARKITHPNVCRVFDLGEDGDLLFLTMELVDGSTLRRVLSEGPMDPGRALDIFQQIVDGVAAAHEKGVVHRDLKPENVLVRRNGQCVVADFGLAREHGEGPSAPGGVAGTPAYMAPEQIRGGALDLRSDVFALGVVGFELLTGRLPFGGDTAEEIWKSISEKPPEALVVPGMAEPTLEALRRLFTKALEKNPGARFASAGDLGAALLLARKTTARGSSKRRWIFLGAGLVATFLLLGNLAPRGPLFPLPVTEAPEEPSLPRAEERPLFAILPFEDSSGDEAWAGVAKSAPEAVRGWLRTMPDIRVADTAPADRADEKAQGVAFLVRGTVRRTGGSTRLAIRIEALEDADAALMGDPLVSASAADLSILRGPFIDEARLLSRNFTRRRRAHETTKSEQAKAYLLQYYALVGPTPRAAHYDAGLDLLGKAIAADPAYVPALVERGYLRSLGAGPGTPEERLGLAIQDWNEASKVAPEAPFVAEMRCRGLQVAAVKRPTESAIRDADEACESALRVAPSSGYVHIALARLYDLRCNIEKATPLFQRGIELDRSLAGRGLRSLVTNALSLGQLHAADRASEELVALHEEEVRLKERAFSRRAGASPVKHAYFLRGAVLMRLERHDEAGKTFEKELAEVADHPGDESFEAGALRGLKRISPAHFTPALSRRLDTLEGGVRVAMKGDIGVAAELADTYAFVDPDASQEWLAKLSPPGSCEQAIQRAIIHQTAGQVAHAKEQLATCATPSPREASCVLELQKLLGP